jgi:tetratricopeptide (TPR) repeat protein
VLALVRQHVWLAHDLRQRISLDRDPQLPHKALREYAARSRVARQRSQLNLLAQLIAGALDHRPVLWEPGDGLDLPAVRHPVHPGVPLFRIYPAQAAPAVPRPAGLVERLRVTLGDDRGLQAARVRSRQLNALGLSYLRLERGRAVLDTARRLFALALRAWPESVAARVNGGVVLARRSDLALADRDPAAARRLLEAAARTTERALARAPNRYTALMNAGRFRLRVAELTRPPAGPAARREIQQARRHFRRARLLQPHLAEPHFNLGVAAARLSQWSAARRHFQRALERDPKFEIARTYLDRVEQQLAAPRRR